MAAYKILFDEDVEKDLSKMPRQIAKNILRKVLSLEHNPRPPHSLKLVGMEDVYRLKIGDYRAIYLIDDPKKVVTVYHIRHRKDVYRNV